MKTDSERQIEYQERRRETQSRITIWVSKDIERSIDAVRGSDSRTTWINGAIVKAIEDKDFATEGEIRLLSLRELKGC
jgi:hypothetical protein